MSFRDRLNRFKERFPLFSFGLEIFSIVLGVLLALAVNEWREAKNHEEQSQQAMRAFEREIRTNQQALQKRLAYHHALRDTIWHFVQHRSPRSYDDFNEAGFQFKGFQTFKLMDTAWETAQHTGVLQHIDYRMTGTLTRLYHLQGVLHEHYDAVSQPLGYPGALDSSRFAGTLRSIAPSMTDVVIREEKLLEAYPEVLRMLSEYTGNPLPDTAQTASSAAFLSPMARE